MRYIKTIFNKWLIALFVVGLAMAGNTLYAQIKVLNIPDGSDVRGLSPDGRAQPNYASYNGVYWRTTFGYHLDGQRTLMHTHYDATNGYTYYYSIADMTRAKAKLTNTANFGPSGTVPYSLSITSNYGVKGSITDIDLIDDYDIIFIGLYDRSYATNKAAFTPEEIAILQEWSAKPGKVLLVMEQALNPTVSAATGYTIVDGSNTNPTTALPYDAQLDINIFSGVFGNSTGISQNGSSQGYFNSNCGGLPLGNNVNGKSTIIFNRKYRDLYFADTGFFTRLNNSTATGQLSSGGAITNATDIAWANIWAWAVSEVVNNVDPGYTTSGGVAYTNQALPLLTGTDAVISLKDNTEQIIRWETSTDGGATWTTINSTSLTITYANPQDGQQFRAVTGNLPECEETISEPVVITVGLPDPCAVLSSDLQPYNGQTNTTQIFSNNVIGIGDARMTVTHPYGSERLAQDRISDTHEAGAAGLNLGHATGTNVANTFDRRIETEISFSAPVKNLSFRINDLDNGDRIRILAYDQNDVLIPLTSANYAFHPSTVNTYIPTEGVTGEFQSTDEDVASNNTRATIDFNFIGKQVSRVVYQYYDVTSGGTYSIAKFSGIDSTDCPDCTNSGETSVNLNSMYTGTFPTGVELQWWTSPTRDLDPTPGTMVTDPENVTASGTYYAFFYDTVNLCYNTDNSTASVVVNILPPCDDCGDRIFIEDFGTSDKDVNKGRTTSPYMPASNSFTFATPYPDSNNSNETAIDNNHYAVVAPGYIKSGWKPEDLGWYFWTPAYDEPNTVTDMSGTEEGAVMAVNAGETLAPFYRREVTLEYDTYYHAAFSIFVKNATSRVGIKVGNSSSDQVYGMMFSQEFTSVDAGKWIDVELTFKVPANSDVDCDMENVYLEFFNAKAATQGNDYYIDNIFLEKLNVSGSCPVPTDFITLVCPADGGSDCTKEPATGTPDGFTKVGVSTMEKQTQGWPENIANGFIGLDSKEKGFVITRVESESSITDPKEGMLIYDIEDQCVKLHNGEEWSCLNQECNAGFTLLCNSFIVISGELHAGQWQGLSGILPFANGDGSAFTSLYNIPSEGITGLTANITLPEGSTINTGTGGFFNVSISGNASAAGIATFPIEINGSSCSIQVEVLP